LSLPELPPSGPATFRIWLPFKASGFTFPLPLSETPCPAFSSRQRFWGSRASAVSLAHNLSTVTSYRFPHVVYPGFHGIASLGSGSRHQHRLTFLVFLIPSTFSTFERLPDVLLELELPVYLRVNSRALGSCAILCPSSGYFTIGGPGPLLPFFLLRFSPLPTPPDPSVLDPLSRLPSVAAFAIPAVPP
jgi:hypothetical protein